MSWNNKVLWSEGLFLRPQHFQQCDRYIESLVDGRCRYLVSYGWGFQELTIDEDLLALGKFALSAARGVLPDGTPFRIPADDAPPVPLEVPQALHGETVFLGVAVRQPGTAEIDADAAGVTRYFRGEVEVRDTSAGDQGSATIEVGKLRLRLLLEQDNRSGRACIGAARIAEVQPDRRVLLEKEFIPPCLDYKVSTYLAGFVTELRGLLKARADELAGRITQPGSRGVAEVADFMLLQIINRLEPLVIHLNEMQGLHPEALYRLLLPMAGELATLTSDARRPPRFPPYVHEDLQATFMPVIAELRRASGWDTVRRVESIPLQKRNYGFYVAPVADRALLTQAAFVLAVTARVSPETLRSQVPALIKFGPVERIQEFVRSALPGIGLRPLPVAPRAIPYHAGFSYFELDRSSQYWKQLESSGGFGLHVAKEFPELQLEFWAIRD